MNIALENRYKYNMSKLRVTLQSLPNRYLMLFNYNLKGIFSCLQKDSMFC